MTDPVAPPGGFQNGGWYEGRQYWNGSFGPPNVIINPNQQGYQKPVSAEVVAQSNVAQGLAPGTNEKYLAEQTAKYYADTGAAPPTSPDQVTGDLNNFQQSLFGSGGDIATRMADLTKLLTGGATAPTPFSRVSEYNNLRTSMGVSDLEKSLTDINKQIADVQSLNEQRQYKAETAPVALGVIGGRQTEIQRQTNIQLDTLNRAKSVMVDELNTKYGIIKTMIDYMGLDYQDAVAAYDKKFQQNMSVYELIYKQAMDAQTAARANLQIYANAITNGNMNYSQLPADQKLMLNKLEIQSGLPVGFVGSLHLSPKDSIIHISSDGTQALVANANGSMSVINTGLSKSSSGGTVAERTQETIKTAYSEMNDILTKLGGTDGIVSGKQWDDAMSQWQQNVPGADVKDFIAAFQKFTNPDWDLYTGINK